jgi:hypothetical protein
MAIEPELYNIEIWTDISKKDKTIIGNALLCANNKKKEIEVNLPRVNTVSAYLILINTILRDYIKRKDLPIKINVPVRELYDILNNKLNADVNTIPYLVTLQSTMKQFKNVTFVINNYPLKKEQATDLDSHQRVSPQPVEGHNQRNKNIEKAIMDAFSAGINCYSELINGLDSEIVVEKYKNIIVSMIDNLQKTISKKED